MQSYSSEISEIDSPSNAEALKRISKYQLTISSKIDHLEKTYIGCNLKVNYIEDAVMTLNKDYEKLYDKLYKKVIVDLMDVMDFAQTQKIINTNNAKKMKELKISTDDYTDFKERVNDVITDLQSRFDNIEHRVTVKKTSIKKIDTLENKVKSQEIKLKALEEASKRDIIPEINTEIEKHFKEYTASMDSRFTNTVKTSENRHNELTARFKHLIGEIDIFRNSKTSSLDIGIDELNQKIKVLDEKLSGINMSKINKSIEIKVNKTDITDITDKIKENGAINNKSITDRIDTIEERCSGLSDKQCLDRVSNMEQQMICLMTDIHNLTHPSAHYDYSAARLYSEPE